MIFSLPLAIFPAVCYNENIERVRHHQFEQPHHGYGGRALPTQIPRLYPHRGYHFAPTHANQDNSPVENVVAMYNAAHKYGRY